MKVKNWFHIISISIIFLAACHSDSAKKSAPKEFIISLSADSASLKLRRLPADLLMYLQENNLNEKDWQSIFSVYPKVSDPELQDFQRPLSGSYLIQDSSIVFSPRDGFVKDSSYLARSYMPNVLKQPSDMIMGHKPSGQSKTAEFVFKR
jgi:hypothetical protein